MTSGIESRQFSGQSSRREPLIISEVHSFPKEIQIVGSIFRGRVCVGNPRVTYHFSKQGAPEKVG